MTGLYNNDFWSLDDSLGIGRAGDHVARMALEVPPPFTLGVTGKWGSGKTSVLRRAFATMKGRPISQALPLAEARDETAKRQLAEDWMKYAYDTPLRKETLEWPLEMQAIASQSLAVWYSPWQHQNAENPLIPLLLEIRTQFSGWMNAGKRKLTKINRQGGVAALTLLERVADVGLSLYTGKPGKYVSGTTEDVRKAWNNEGDDYLTKLSDGQRFHLLFEDAVENVLDCVARRANPKTLLLNESRLVIFIDDLDRCEESVVVSLLEGIKLYLGTSRCVFVLGMDHTAVQNALTRHWPNRSVDDNREYLEKLFQSVITLPLPSHTNISMVASMQLTKHEFPDAGALAHDIEALLEPNPRKIKNFLNSLCSAWTLYGQKDPNADNARRFVMFHYLRLFHGPVWRILERQPWALALLHQTLAGHPDPLTNIPKWVKEPEQRVLKELFSRSFSHVLQDDTSEKGDEARHRRMTLDKAVALLEERLDRKRSDEYFVSMFRDLVAKNQSVPDAVLFLLALPAGPPVELPLQGEGQ